MGEQDGVKAADTMPEHLLSEVRTRVDHDAHSVRLDHEAAPQAFVSGIFGATDLAVAGDHGDSAAGSRAE
jgi:hypothetical protein